MLTPYPFERLPRVSRMQVAALGELRLALSTLAREPLASVARTLLSATSVTTRLGTVDIWPIDEAAARLAEPGFIVQLSHGLARADQCVLLEANAHTASYLAGRVLGSEAVLADAQAGVNVADFEQGVLAYALARVLVASGSGFELHRMPRSAATAIRALGPHTSAVVVCPIEVTTDERTFWLRLLWPGAMRAPHVAAPSNELEPWVAALPVTMKLDVGAAELRFAEVAALGVGDIVLPDRSELAPASSGFAGRVRGRVAFAPWSLTFRLEDPSRLTLVERVIDKGRAKQLGALVTKQDDGTHDLELARELPVVLELVVGKVTLSVAELSSLRAGDVLTTRAAVGQHVSLESAGRPIAEGELVDVDGELGVRVLRVVARDRA